MKKRILRNGAIACAVLLLLAGICLLVWHALASADQSAFQAQRWAGDSGMPFTQLSCFFGAADETDLEGIYALRQKLNETFTQEGMAREDGGELFCDAWSAMGKVQVDSERESANAEVLAVGGSFFDFHPMELLSGCVLRQSDLMKDRVVLDELLAWLLFGSSDVAGLQVEIGGLPFEVAGVVRQEDSRAIRAFREQSPTLYIPYETWKTMGSSGISCYEIVLPEPVEGYGQRLLQENFTIGDGVVQAVSQRFTLSGSWNLLKNYRLRGTQTQAVALPYWENAARYQENRCAAWLLAALVLLAFPALCACIGVVWLWVMARRGLRRGLPWLWRRIGDGLYALSGKLTPKRKRD